MAKVIAREAIPSTTKSMEDQSKSESVKFTLQVKAIFRKTEDSVVNGLAKRQNVSLFVFTKDLDCKCPKMKIKKYENKTEFEILTQFLFNSDHILYLETMMRDQPALSESEITQSSSNGVMNGTVVCESISGNRTRVIKCMLISSI